MCSNLVNLDQDNLDNLTQRRKISANHGQLWTFYYHYTDILVCPILKTVTLLCIEVNAALLSCRYYLYESSCSIA